ncbi:MULTISPECIES: bifunctional nicotinamidase/pyrazinamidase [Mesonia]|uniref:Nicotinamidase n=1 Tax=Mesonia oceanica TaxID=2687242 RepID=A0AC61Y6Q4_9FLAO|nr:MULTISPECIES: bifunctional nicotinamidase/pyrazinamidase [Mesonia]MAN28253.1 nicotinamidase/pyrazinamidase [Mesonia sp.]MAQ41490.1 nicotinamidase/pyrazinamidase [Mesonia sp.]VVU99029.1 Nicotinamidase [Mesonia oceanica]|tara:strand:- start:289 stop:894 length:606 start_codon:yes stop_codon:yes gene_type:complete
MKVLIIIDAQNDFMPGGSLAVPQGNKIIPVINQILPQFELVIATQDWHPENHISLAKNHLGKNEFESIQVEGIKQTLWPAHCIQNTSGADFHKDLQTEKIEAIFRKGTHPMIDSYSGFYDNAHLKSTGLAGYLREKQATELYFCGLAADICVSFTVKDALKEGFVSYLIEDATKALNEEDFAQAKRDIQALGGKIVNSAKV